MPSMVLPAAEWISSTPRQASVPDAGAYGASSDSPPSSVSPQHAAGIAGPSSSESQHVDVHRGSGGLVRGRAVFCLPPDALWFQGHFAYAARGGCTASLGVLGTELPVDPVSTAVCIIRESLGRFRHRRTYHYVRKYKGLNILTVNVKTVLICTDIFERAPAGRIYVSAPSAVPGTCPLLCNEIGSARVHPEGLVRV